MKVVITQPYVPAYRVPLFRQLAKNLKAEKIELVVAAGQPEAMQAKRGDLAHADWVVPINSRQIRIAGRTLQLRTVPQEHRNADLVVSELEALNTFAWGCAARGQPFILWGHGKSYVHDTSHFADRVEWTLAKRSRRVLTYAPSGRDYLIDEGGLNPDSVVSIGNSTDTTTLRRSIEGLTPDELQETRSMVGGGSRAMFIGGLDESKRIPFLLECATAARAIDPPFQLIVVGMGVLAPLVKAAESSGSVRHILSARGRDLARLAAMAGSVWMPGRVGLVAVDALAFGLPLNTTQFAYHAPEIEFMPASDVHYLPSDAASFAEAALRSAVPPMDANMRSFRGDIPSVERAASSFAAVIFEELSRLRRK